ncbi:DUF3987 domain-containing protein [Flavobacterium ardleyense]|uniref:DUF3987 domain-containing protein n=1 Tax=Flavobacterium ardleyense TaxID=2038737 RepID=UPI00298D4E29|nr:DUF3987 domain-containing protein [Flavobacterium ardleyense]
MATTNNGAPNTLGSIRGSNISFKNKDTENNSKIDLSDLEKDFSVLTEKNENPFPTEVFPKDLQAIIYHAHNNYQFSIDYLGAGCLSAMSAAIGISYKVEVLQGWLEKCNLFMVIVGRTGDAKSHALNFCFKPIQKREKALFQKYEQEMRDYERSLGGDQEKVEKPFLERLLINDSTPEALIQAHSNNKRSLCIYMDELHGWIKNFNRYNSSGEEQTYLTLWSGGVITVDRVSSKSIRLDDPFIGVIGGTQISVLKEFAKGGRSANGFLDRMLFVFPEVQKNIKWSDNKQDEIIMQNYFAIITDLIDLKLNPNNESNIICFEAEAKKFLFDWQNARPENYLFEYERSIEVKLQQYVIRFALILQLVFNICEDKTDKEIQLFAVKGGIKLFEYFYFNAIKVRDETIKKNYNESLSELQRTILDDLPSNSSFSTADAIKIACIIVNGKPRISERQVKTYLKDRKLFKKVSHGFYQKIQ